MSRKPNEIIDSIDNMVWELDEARKHSGAIVSSSRSNHWSHVCAEAKRLRTVLREVNQSLYDIENGAEYQHRKYLAEKND